MLDFRLVAEALQERGLLIQKLAPHLIKPVPVRLPAAAPRLGAALRRLGRRALRHPRSAVGPGPGRPPPPPPHPPRGPAHRPRAQEGRAGGRTAVLRRAGGRRAPHDVHRPHGRGLRRARGVAGAGRRAAQGGRAGRRRPGARPGVGPRVRRPGPAGRQRHRRVDRRDAGAGRRARAVPRPGEQGDPPRRAPRPDPLGLGADPAHREVGAVHHPVGPALDHRDDRHRLGARPRPPRRERRGHPVPARPRQLGDRSRRSPTRTSKGSTPGCGRCCRASRSRRPSSPASTPWRTPSRGWW